MKILKMAIFYGTVQLRLSIDGRVFLVGIDVGGLDLHDYGAQALVVANDGIHDSYKSLYRITHQN